MKSKWIFMLLIAAGVLFGFTASEIFKTHHAEVNQIQGVYVFYQSKPVRAYDYLGTVESPMIIKNYKGSYLIDMMIRRAKKKHASCNAVIFKNDNLTELDAVVIK